MCTWVSEPAKAPAQHHPPCALPPAAPGFRATSAMSQTLPLSLTASARLPWVLLNSGGAPDDNARCCGSRCQRAGGFVYAGGEARLCCCGEICQVLWKIKQGSCGSVTLPEPGGPVSPKISPTVTHLSHSNGSSSSSHRAVPVPAIPAPPYSVCPAPCSLCGRTPPACAAGGVTLCPDLCLSGARPGCNPQKAPRVEDLVWDSSAGLCPLSLLFTARVNAEGSRPCPEGLAINKMPFMERFLPGSSNEKHFAVFYLIWMPQGDWWEVCSSEASLAHDPETLRSGFGFSQPRLLVTHKLVSCFQMREGDRGKLADGRAAQLSSGLRRLLSLSQRCC